MENNMNKNRTKNIIRNICISTVILFIGIILVLKAFKIDQGSKKLLYSYNINQNANYTVKLSENDFFENTDMEMNKTYISSLVDKINMDYYYSLSGNKSSSAKYTYEIVALTDVKYSSTSSDKEDTVWQKQEVLVPQKQLEKTGSGFSINENFDVDFAKYNNQVKSFKEQLRIPIKATLQVKLIVKSDLNVSGLNEPVIETSIMNVDMNLAQDVFTIDKQYKDSDTKEICETIKPSQKVNKPLIIIGAILVFIAIIIILDSIRKSIKFSKKSDYAIALNRILKNYGDIVAEIVSPVEIDNLNVIEVKNFDQLLDIEEEIRMPILFYETIPDEQGEFIIVCDNMAYRYVIG